MIDFTGVNAITIPEGSVLRILNASGEVLWEKDVDEDASARMTRTANVTTGTTNTRVPFTSATISNNAYFAYVSGGYVEVLKDVVVDVEAYVRGYQSSSGGGQTYGEAMRRRNGSDSMIVQASGGVNSAGTQTSGTATKRNYQLLVGDRVWMRVRGSNSRMGYSSARVTVTHTKGQAV